MINGRRAGPRLAYENQLPSLLTRWFGWSLAMARARRPTCLPAHITLIWGVTGLIFACVTIVTRPKTDTVAEYQSFPLIATGLSRSLTFNSFPCDSQLVPSSRHRAPPKEPYIWDVWMTVQISI